MERLSQRYGDDPRVVRHCSGWMTYTPSFELGSVPCYDSHGTLASKQRESSTCLPPRLRPRHVLPIQFGHYPTEQKIPPSSFGTSSSQRFAGEALCGRSANPVAFTASKYDTAAVMNSLDDEIASYIAAQQEETVDNCG